MVIQNDNSARRVEKALLARVQRYIDDNSVFRVEFGHYEGIKWISLKTHRINIGEAFNASNDGISEEESTVC